MAMKGWIGVDNLTLTCHLGVSDEEQRHPREVQVDVAVFYDMTAAAGSDDIADAVDYRTISSNFCGIAQARSYRLIETLAAALLDELQKDPRVLHCRLRVQKRRAFPDAHAVFVELTT